MVLGILLMRWLPKAISERGRSDQMAADLQSLASHDEVTDVLNRRAFDEISDAEWVRFQRYGRPLSLLLVDVDGFKAINDSFGQQAGDAALRAVANAAASVARVTDSVARVGGDEFAILLPETDEAAAAALAARLDQQIRSLPVRAADQQFDISVSVGVASASLGMRSFETLLKRSDDALYRAKGANKGKQPLQKPLFFPQARASRGA